MRKKTGILLTALLLCCAFILAWLCLAPAIRVNMLPRASREKEQETPGIYLYGSLPYDWDKQIIESYVHPDFTKTNHFLKVRFVSAEMRAVESHADGCTFAKENAGQEPVYEIITLKVLDNLSDSDINPGDKIRLYCGTHEANSSYFKGKDAVYFSVPFSSDGTDCFLVIDGETYYGAPAKNELFFLSDGRIYPYRDITYEEEYNYERLNILRFTGLGNPYAQYCGMTGEEFHEAVLPLLKNPRS